MENLLFMIVLWLDNLNRKFIGFYLTFFADLLGSILFEESFLIFFFLFNRTKALLPSFSRRTGARRNLSFIGFERDILYTIFILDNSFLCTFWCNIWSFLYNSKGFIINSLFGFLKGEKDLIFTNYSFKIKLFSM